MRIFLSIKKTSIFFCNLHFPHYYELPAIFNVKNLSMKEETYQTPFSMAILTSLFVGFFTTIFCLVYDIIYRDETGFPLSDIINVSSLIFVVNFLFFLIGLIYSIFAKRSKKIELIFIGLFVLLTILGAIGAESVIRSPDHVLTLQFRGLLLGVVIIIGIGVLCIPLLFHNKTFREKVL